MLMKSVSVFSQYHATFELVLNSTQRVSESKNVRISIIMKIDSTCKGVSVYERTCSSVCQCKRKPPYETIVFSLPDVQEVLPGFDRVHCLYD